MSTTETAVQPAPPGARCRDASVRPLLDTWDRLDEQLWSPISAALAEATAAHAEVVAELALDEGAPSDRAELAERLTAYVRGVSKAVHEPLAVALGRHEAIAQIDAALREGFAAAEAGCRELPEREPLAWGDALVAHPSDNAGRGAAKALARVFSAARRPEASREAPIRAAALRHLQRRAVPAQAAAGRAALAAWGRWIGQLERTWAAWTQATLGSLLTELAEQASPQSADSSAEADDDDAPRERASWGAVAEAARALSVALESLASSPHAEVGARLRRDLEIAHGQLDQDIALAGSLVLPLDGEPPAPGDPWGRGSDVVDGWTRWWSGALARIRLHEALLGVVIGSDAIRARLADELRGGATADFGESALVGAQAFRELRARVDAPASRDAAALGEHLSACEAAARGLVARHLKPPSADRLLDPVRRTTDQATEALQALVRQVPARLALHPVPDAEEELTRPPRDSHELPLLDVTLQAFDALRMERVRTGVEPVSEAVEALRSQLEELHEVVGFGFEAAAKELAEAAEGADERALALAAGGLRRTAEALEGLPDFVAEAQDRMDGTIALEIARGCKQVVERALAHGVQGQLLDARSRAEASVRRMVSRAVPGLQAALERLRARWAGARKRIDELIRAARALVGPPAQPPAATLRSLRGLARAGDDIDGIPLVYRRLFTLDPIGDEVLLAGRAAELAEIETRWTRWEAEEGVPLMVIGRPGVGVTSLFNVVTARAGARGASTVRATLDERYGTEARVAAWLAELLGLDPPKSIDALVKSILQAPKGGVPDLIVVDGLEHAYLRTPGGTDLVERIITLMTETEPRMFWISSVTRSAWQLIETAEPNAVSQVEVLELPPLGPEALRDAILARHRRSGVPLEYQEPQEGRRLLRRRLRGLQGTEGHQRLLEDDFFDRLHRASSGNLRLALYQWLRSVDFGTGRGELLVHPLSPVDLSSLESLGLTQNFTLKAFLEHQSLTLAEHDTIFRIPRQESYQVFESLRNRHLIEPIAVHADEPSVSEIEENLRYRIVPILSGAVAAHLASRNIVH